MKDRERIAEINKLSNDLRISHFHEVGAGELAEKLVELGYTRQPEPVLELVKNKYPITGRGNDPDYMDGIVRDAYAEGCADQLAHDREAVRGNDGN